jgi:hypothetical protein
MARRVPDSNVNRVATRRDGSATQATGMPVPRQPENSDVTERPGATAARDGPDFAEVEVPARGFGNRDEAPDLVEHPWLDLKCQ